jgi:hypothetical protein
MQASDPNGSQNWWNRREIIILGLVIALGGAIWQWRHRPITGPAHGGQSTIVSPGKRYSAYDIEKRLHIIDGISDFLETRMRAASADAIALQGTIRGKMRDGTAIETLIAFADKSDNIFVDFQNMETTRVASRVAWGNPLFRERSDYG